MRHTYHRSQGLGPEILLRWVMQPRVGGAASWERRAHEGQWYLRRVCADLQRPPQRVANRDTGHSGEFGFQINRIIFNTNLSRTTLSLTNVNTLVYLMFKLGCICWRRCPGDPGTSCHCPEPLSLPEPHRPHLRVGGPGVTLQGLSAQGVVLTHLAQLELGSNPRNLPA